MYHNISDRGHMTRQHLPSATGSADCPTLVAASELYITGYHNNK